METKIPHTKNEAFAQLDAMLSEEDKSEFAKSDAIEYHFTLGMWIRNNWIYGQKEEDVKQLAKAFRTEMLFFEADDLSMKIIEDYQRYLKKERVIDYGNIKRVSMQRLWLYHNWHQERSYVGYVWRNRNRKGSEEMP